MSKQIFITLPVADLAKSVAFFEALGFSKNPEFTGDNAACMALSEAIFVMLAPHATFMQFSPKPICDTSKVVEVLHSFTCDSREQVDAMVAAAGKAGGTIHEESVDYGFMYHGSFADPDGHLWGLNYMTGQPPKC